MSEPDASFKIGIPSDPAVTAIIAAFESTGHQVRYAGGFVRDTLLGVPAGDIDLATTARPDETVQALKAADIRFVTPGFDHGTVTAVFEGRGIEITSLRRDVATDGRHAIVAFGADWREDALRRDFTMNALFAEPDGTIHDYVGGVEDALAGRVRFVGDADQRIKEDYLRVLRFFRFFARFGEEGPSAELLAILKDNADHLERLSAERVTKEILGLLCAKNPSVAWRLMASLGIDRLVLGEEVGPATSLQVLVAAELAVGIEPSGLRRLAQLGSAGSLVLSNDQTAHLAAVTQARELFAAGGSRDESRCRLALYRYGRDAAMDGLLIAGLPAETATILSELPVPEFPIKGQDVLDLGIAPGEEVGELLELIERWWIDNGLLADRRTCLQKLNTVMNLSS